MMSLQKNPIKVIFLDRDGTIIKDTGFPYKKTDLSFKSYSIEGLRRMAELGYNLIIVTNQSGISRGLFTEAEYYNFNNYILDALRENDIKIDHVFQCFHSPEENCNCRKPRTGMVSEYLSENIIDFNHSFTIGDKKTDVEFGKNINTNTILINSELVSPYSIESEQHYIAKHLLSASNLIENLYAAK